MLTPQNIATTRGGELFSKLDQNTRMMNVELMALKMPASVAVFMNHHGNDRIDAMMLMAIDVLDMCYCMGIKAPTGRVNTILPFNRQCGHGMLEEVAAICLAIGQQKTGVINTAQLQERLTGHSQNLAAYVNIGVKELNKHDNFITFCNQAWENLQ